MARTELFVRKQSGGMFSVVNQALTTGNIFFVNSANGTNSAGYGQNPMRRPPRSTTRSGCAPPTRATAST
jgi:hypothetical protein